MPNVEGTPRKTVRVDDDLWTRAGQAVGEKRRGEVIRDFLRWLTHETDELPARPPKPQG
jgi:Arc/MetJ family transcription regulator